jgi:zinc protease
MKCLVVIIFVLGLAACSSAPKGKDRPAAGSSVTKGSPDIKSSDQKTGFKLRDYKVEQWPNGLEVLTVEDHSLPSIGFGLLLKDGSTADPMAKSGLMNLMGQVIDRGTSKKSAAQISDELGQLGSDFDQSVADDYSWFQVTGLSNHQNELWEIFSDVILHPRFEQKEIDREKKIVLAAIKRRMDHPDHFASEAFEAFLFGGHPYGRPVSGLERDVQSIVRKDLVKMYDKRFRPNNSVLVVAGDINKEVMARIKVTLGGWASRPMEPKNFARPPNFSGVNVRLIDKADLTQTQIVLGHLGVKRNVDEYLALRVANTILGGNFSSRLMDQVRVKLGLTYGISSNFDGRLDRGPFFIWTFTKNQSAGQAISETLKVFNEYYSKGVTKEEVDLAKNFMEGSFPRAIETPERLGFNLALLRLYGLSDDYLRNFVGNVESISSSEVNNAIKKYLNPKDLKILVLTKASDSVDQIRPLGLLEIKDYQEVF